MIIKKTLVTTSTFAISAVLLSQAYTFTANRIKYREINYSAFVNLANNVKSMTAGPLMNQTIKEDTSITRDIIKVIEKEVTHKNVRAKYSVLSLKKKIVKDEVVATAASQTNIENGAFDLSHYEINNKEFISLYAFSAERISFSKFENIALSPNYNEELKDEVILAQASTNVAPIEADEVKTIQPATYKTEIAEEYKAPEKNSEKENDELVMFEYSDKKESVEVSKDMDKKLYDRPLSDTVKNAISREIGSTPISNISMSTHHENIHMSNKEEIAKADQNKDIYNDNENIIYDYSVKDESKKESSQAKAKKEDSNAFLSTQNIQIAISAKEINLNTHKSTQVNGFEFVPDYDRAERVSDQNNGIISFGYNLSGLMNTQTGVVQAQGMIPTRVELNLGVVSAIEVPLLNEEGIQKLLQKKNLSIEGNLLMIALNSKVLDVEVDSRFEKKFFFDKAFKLLPTMTGASFVMFAGTNTGNVLIRYFLSTNETAQKIVYVGNGEMYFEDPSFIEGTRETFSLTTRTILGQKKKELVIDASAISFFNTKNIAKKKTLNAYELKIPTLISGMRKYLEFKHLKDSIFVGTWNELEIEIPSNDFIAKVLEMNQINSLKDRCVVQVNINKDLREIKVNGKNRSGEMFVETSFLDSDGNFSRDSSERAEKAFIVGDMEGQLGIRLDYKDDSSEFVKTFCSEGSYLVEQL